MDLLKRRVKAVNLMSGVQCALLESIRQRRRGAVPVRLPVSIAIFIVIILRQI